MDLGAAQGIAVRVKHMKLLVNVTCVPWFMPPEFNDTLTPNWNKNMVITYILLDYHTLRS